MGLVPVPMIPDNQPPKYGHNQPPGMIETAQTLWRELGTWLGINPRIDDATVAGEGKLLRDRVKNALADLDAERQTHVRPLNEQVKSINTEYRTPREDLEKIEAILRDRLRGYAEAEQKKRDAAAEQARIEAAEAERKAREAEALEESAKTDAASGVVTDVAGATREADQAFAAYAKAERQAARLERDAEKVGIVGGFKPKLGFKEHEVLVLDNWHTAVAEMGLTEDISEAILREAKQYRRITGQLPAGISTRMERTF